MNTNRSKLDSFRTELTSERASSFVNSSRTVLNAVDSHISHSNSSVCSSKLAYDERPQPQLININKKRNTLAMPSHNTFNKLHKETTNFYHLNTLNSTKRQTVPTLNLGMLKEKFQTFNGMNILLNNYFT